MPKRLKITDDVGAGPGQHGEKRMANFSLTPEMPRMTLRPQGPSPRKSMAARMRRKTPGRGFGLNVNRGLAPSPPGGTAFRAPSVGTGRNTQF